MGKINMKICVADYIIISLRNRKLEITNKKLQKLLYFCDAYYMTRNQGESMFPDEEFKAWEFGPVLLSVYKEYLDRDTELKDGTTEIRSLKPLNDEKIINNTIPEDIKVVVDEILQYLGNINVENLINSTHVKGGPWDVVYNDKTKSNLKRKMEEIEISLITIDKKAMYDFYREKTISEYLV